MYIHDDERKSRPFHIYDGGDRFAAFALCTKVFDLRPGLTIEPSVSSEDLICGLCLRERQRRHNAVTQEDRNLADYAFDMRAIYAMRGDQDRVSA